MNFFELTEDGKKRCIHGAPAPCSDSCPLGIDVREFIKHVRSGLIASAYKTFQLNAVMPGIVCHICPEPCRAVCVRKETDDPISLKALEHFCWQKVHEQKKKSYFMRQKEERMLICGGDIGQLTVALKLAKRGYPVDLAIKSDRLGETLWDLDESILPRAVLEEELNEVEAEKFITVLRNAEQASAEKLMEYDAVLLTETPDEIAEHQEIVNDEHIFIWKDAGSHLHNIHQGNLISYQMEEYVKIHKVFKTKELEKKEKPYCPELSSIEKKPKLRPEDEKNWTEDEAVAEAERCIMCQCTRCADVCPMMTYYNQDYKLLAVSITDTVEAQEIDRKRGLYPLMSCMQCGACVQACPVDIDTKSMCLLSRRLIHKKKTLPVSHYNFWLNDMEHANREANFMIPSEGKGEYVYFPGCQMGASYPAYVESSYEWLRSTYDGKVTLWNRCCCAPAYWCGNEELYAKESEEIRAKWEELDSPVFILSCPTCMEQFKDNFPEIKTVSLWSLLADNMARREKNGQEIAVFDSCAARDDRSMQEDIRKIVAAAGYEVTELDNSKENARCCGYGGLVYSTNPELIREVIDDNCRQDDHELVTYCTNCMDSFRSNDKEARFIFDLVFDIEPQQEAPDLTERRRNRMKLKEEMLDKYTNIAGEQELTPYQDICLVLDEAIKANINKQLLLEDNIRAVIGNAEENGMYLYDEEEDVRIAHRKSGYITVWVVYRKLDADKADKYEVCNTYFHRATLKGEQNDGE